MFLFSLLFAENLLVPYSDAFTGTSLEEVVVKATALLDNCFDIGDVECKSFFDLVVNYPKTLLDL